MYEDTVIIMTFILCCWIKTGNRNVLQVLQFTHKNSEINVIELWVWYTLKSVLITLKETERLNKTDSYFIKKP